MLQTTVPDRSDPGYGARRVALEDVRLVYGREHAVRTDEALGEPVRQSELAVAREGTHRVSMSVRNMQLAGQALVRDIELLQW